MKKSEKMNGLYKAAFILLLVGIACLAAAIIVAYVLNKYNFSVAVSGVGCVITFIGIILGWSAKPKEDKPVFTEDISDEQNDQTAVDLEK